MKNGNAMILGSIAQLIKEGWRPKRNITIAMFADEEAGGKYGSHYVVNNHGEYFDNASEAVGEVGGFSHTLSNGVRLYLIETAQKGIAWMKLTAKGTAGHGSMINSDNAISKISGEISQTLNVLGQIKLLVADIVENSAVTDLYIGTTEVAGTFIPGKTYTIKSIGSTDFTEIGATSNTVDLTLDRKSTRLNSSHIPLSRMPSSA